MQVQPGERHKNDEERSGARFTAPGPPSECRGPTAKHRNRKRRQATGEHASVPSAKNFVDALIVTLLDSIDLDPA
jgi:hypothetical protein